MPDKDLTRLEEVLIARASARQRRGRAGRTRPGLCFKLYTRHTESATMEEFSKPEILRVPLEQVSLSAKAMNEEGNVTVSFCLDSGPHRSNRLSLYRNS